MIGSRWFVRLICAGLLAASISVVPCLAAQTAGAPAVSNDMSGMFTFLREGEFVQLTVEDGQLSGFVSRFGDTQSDKDEFIDQFFEKAALQGNHLTFKTKTVHAVWYEFDGKLTTVAGKLKGEEGFRELDGKLTMHKEDATGKEQVMQRTVQLKSFPDAQHMRR